ncbi:MAG: anthranilate synthase component I family protein [archaeon]
MKIKVTSEIAQIKYQEPFKLYLKESQNGNTPSLLMESKSPNQKYPRKSIIVPNPAVKIEGKNEEFKITALNKAGKKILNFFSKKDFDYAINYFQDKKTIKGKVLKQENKNANEEKEAKLKNISCVIKTVLNKFDSSDSCAGVYGVFAYDFAKNFYKVEERQKEENINDFELFLPTKIYLLHDNEKRAEMHEFLFNSEKFEEEKPKKSFSFKKQKKQEQTDLSDDQYKEVVAKSIEEIKKGRVIQCVLSRKTTVSLQKHPIKSYELLRATNPSPYSFYYNLGNNEILYGASPEMHIKIYNTKKGKEIEIRPIAGTIMRSKNPLEDAEARKNLLNDEKEIREHTMLVDLARHEIYKLSKTNSVEVIDLFTLENYPNLYHLVSGIKGMLKENKDAVDALLITLPAGTLSGAPKQEAMKMIEEYEGSKRGYYGGASGLLAFNGECNTGITIRTIYVKNNNSEVRGGAGITALSTPEKELNEIKLKTSKAMEVLG